MKLCEFWDPPRELDLVDVEIEIGLKEDYLVAGRNRRLEGDVQRLGRANSDADVVSGGEGGV